MEIRFEIDVELERERWTCVTSLGSSSDGGRRKKAMYPSAWVITLLD